VIVNIIIIRFGFSVNGGESEDNAYERGIRMCQESLEVAVSLDKSIPISLNAAVRRVEVSVSLNNSMSLNAAVRGIFIALHQMQVESSTVYTDTSKGLKTALRGINNAAKQVLSLASAILENNEDNSFVFIVDQNTLFLGSYISTYICICI
jgi:hypothetical protein